MFHQFKKDIPNAPKKEKREPRDLGPIHFDLGASPGLFLKNRKDKIEEIYNTHCKEIQSMMTKPRTTGSHGY